MSKAKGIIIWELYSVLVVMLSCSFSLSAYIQITSQMQWFLYNGLAKNNTTTGCH